jgi:Zn-dependent protease
MGAGMSTFLVPILIAINTAGQGTWVAGSVTVFLLILGAFNFLNLLPMSRFDGGQVLKQVFPAHDALWAQHSW